MKPSGVSFVDAAGCIGDSVKAYTALHYLGRLSLGDTGEVAVFLMRSLNPEDSKLLGSTRKNIFLLVKMWYRNTFLFGNTGVVVDHAVDDTNFIVSEVFTLHMIKLYARCFCLML